MPRHPSPPWLAIAAACLLVTACSSRPPRAVLVVTSAAKAAPSAAAGSAASAKPSASPTPVPAAAADDGHDHEHDEATASTTPVADDGHDHEHEESAATAVSYKADVVPMLREHCASCHVPGGGVPEHAHWFDAAGEPQYQTIKDHAGIMVRLIKAGEMPKGRPNSVPPELVEELDSWRKAGAPQN